MNFIFKALLKKQLKGVPEDQLDMIIAAIEKNPAFFEQMAAKINAKMAAGMSQEEAAKQIMAESGSELRQILGK